MHWLEMLNFRELGLGWYVYKLKKIILDMWEVLGLFTLANGVQQAEFIARNEKIFWNLLHI